MVILSAAGCIARNNMVARRPTARKDNTAQALPSDAMEGKQSWVKPIAVPADAELEKQIWEVQDALKTIAEQMVRHKDALEKTQDLATRETLADGFERLRKEREGLEKLLHALTDEAKLSEQTTIDEALARARWLEQQQERWQQEEEGIRDRQQ